MRRFDQQGHALATTLAALATEQAAREDAAVEAERSRIAVEMHDVVAHAVSLMVVQVGATRMELERDGSKQPRLRTAEQTGRDALEELRRTLGVLRRGPTDDLHPLPGLAAVPALVQGFRDAGLDVALQLDDVGVIAISTELAAYRILQEALTNALKHGGGRSVSASLRRVGDNLVVDVTNPLAEVSAARRGGNERATRNGLAGMRERASMFSGSIRAERTHGRFEVHAVLPLADLPVRWKHLVIRVVVADDQGLVRAGLCAILASQDDISIVGEAADGAEAIEVVRSTRPDVVLMDVRMPGVDGIEATRQLADCSARILMLTTFDLDKHVYAAMKAGACGFLLKDAMPESLIDAVRAAARGEALLAPQSPRDSSRNSFVARTRRHDGHQTRTANSARTGSASRSRPGTLQHRDRPTALPLRGHSQDARHPVAHQAPAA